MRRCVCDSRLAHPLVCGLRLPGAALHCVVSAELELVRRRNESEIPIYASWAAESLRVVFVAPSRLVSSLSSTCLSAPAIAIYHPPGNTLYFCTILFYNNSALFCCHPPVVPAPAIPHGLVE